MKKKAQAPTIDEWLNELNRLDKESTELPEDKDWLTSAELSLKLNMTLAKVRNLLSKGIANKTIKCRKTHKIGIDGRRAMVPIYKLTTKI